MRKRLCLNPEYRSWRGVTRIPAILERPRTGNLAVSTLEGFLVIATNEMAVIIDSSPDAGAKRETGDVTGEELCRMGSAAECKPEVDAEAVILGGARSSEDEDRRLPPAAASRHEMTGVCAGWRLFSRAHWSTQDPPSAPCESCPSGPTDSTCALSVSLSGGERALVLQYGGRWP